MRKFGELYYFLSELLSGNSDPSAFLYKAEKKVITLLYQPKGEPADSILKINETEQPIRAAGSSCVKSRALRRRLTRFQMNNPYG
jgi:hypothetical protein